jgi:hypothetical protein
VRRAAFFLAALLALLQAVSLARADGEAQDGAASGGESALAQAELDRLIGQLGEDSVDDRRSAAKAISELGGDAVPAVLAKLSDVRRGGEGGAIAAMKPVREKVLRDPGFDVVEGLVQEKPEPGAQRLLLAACLMRALAHAGTAAAVRGMTPLASDLGGQLRPELARQVKQLGDRAVPGLLLSRHDPSSEVRGWTTSQLEALGKRTPGDMVQTPDNQVIADVLRAYAALKDLDALPVVLSFVNSDHATVRAAARDATLAYGQEAAWKIREAYAVLTGDPAPEGATAGELAKKLFDAYDRYRLDEVYALLDDGLAKQKAHDLKGAIAAFDEALARQPLLDRRAEMAPAYAEYGESLEDRDRPAALANLRKAVRLDSAGDRTRHVQSELLYLEGEDLLAQGIQDAEPFEQAVALDASNGRARAELDRMRAQVVSGRARTYRVVFAGALLALALVAIAVFGGKRRAASVLR